MNEKREIKRLFIFDFRILLAIIFLMIAGGVAVYSSTYSAEASRTSWLFLKYLFFSVTGLVIMCITMFINYTKLAEHRMSLYIPMIVLLVLVLIPNVGTTINGSSSWLFGIQPSEFGKLVMIIFLAGYLDQIGDKIKEEKYFALAGLFIVIPIALVLMQPDLGTVLVYCFIVFVMLFVGGVPIRYILALMSIGIIGLSIPMFLEYKRMSDDINNVLFNFLSQRIYIGYLAGVLLFIAVLLLTINFYMSNKYIESISFMFFVLFLSMCAALVFDIGLKNYQKERLLVFMNPQLTRVFNSRWKRRITRRRIFKRKSVSIKFHSSAGKRFYFFKYMRRMGICRKRFSHYSLCRYICQRNNRGLFGERQTWSFDSCRSHSDVFMPCDNQYRNGCGNDADYGTNFAFRKQRRFFYFNFFNVDRTYI